MYCVGFHSTVFWDMYDMNSFSLSDFDQFLVLTTYISPTLYRICCAWQKLLNLIGELLKV